LRFVPTHMSAGRGLALAPDDTAAGAMAALARITGRSARLVQRLFNQIERDLASRDSNATPEPAVGATT
jgi:hypothetical protein